MTGYVFDEMYIAVCNVEIAKDWKRHLRKIGLDEDLPNPVSVFHTLTNCSRCNAFAWIGPQQKQQAQQPGSTVVCYRCIARDKEFMAQEQMPIISLDPHADDKPRMF